MEVLKVVLVVLKFGAIAVGSVSGIIGVMTKTRDESGKPTPWGKRLVALIVASAIIAGFTQSAESYLKRKSDAAAAVQTRDILSSAKKAADDTTVIQERVTASLKTLERNVNETRDLRDKASFIEQGIENQRKVAEMTTARIQQTAKNLGLVLSEQRVFNYGQQHLIGGITAEIDLSFPVDTSSAGVMNPEFAAWAKGVREARKQRPETTSVPPSQQNLVEVFPDDIPKRLKQLNISIRISKNLPGTTGHDAIEYVFSPYDVSSSGTVSFTGDRATVFVHVKGSCGITSQTKSHSWLDLYGKELYLNFLNTPHNLYFGSAFLKFDNTDQTIFLNPRLMTGPGWILSEQLLGPKPRL